MELCARYKVGSHKYGKWYDNKNELNLKRSYLCYDIHEYVNDCIFTYPWPSVYCTIIFLIPNSSCCRWNGWLMVTIPCWNANLNYFNSLWMENRSYPSQLNLQWNVDRQNVFLSTSVKKNAVDLSKCCIGSKFRITPNNNSSTPPCTLNTSVIVLIWLEAEDT